MQALIPLEPVDYLMIGHLTEDVTTTGTRLGGTAAFSALTAKAFGLRVGIVTSMADEISVQALDGIPVLKVPATHTTTFENLRTPGGRVQILRRRASDITLDGLPDSWRKAPIVHLGPVAQEISPQVAGTFSGALLGVTPQGWMRSWDEAGNVSPCPWASADEILPKAAAVVLSRADLGGDDEAVHCMAQQTRLLAVTDGAAGAELYWNGDSRRFRPPAVNELDDTGAGDIFAAALFIRLYMTRDPWEAARFATLLAAKSVTRSGLQGVPTSADIEACSIEVIH